MCKVASTCGFVIDASLHSFVRFFNENIKKSQEVVQFYFFGKLNLIWLTAKIANKSINRRGNSKSSKTYQCF